MKSTVHTLEHPHVHIIKIMGVFRVH